MSRHLRWAQLRRWCAIGPFLAEPLAYPAPLLLSSAVLARAAELPVALPRAALFGVLLKLLADAMLAKRLRGTAPPLVALALSPLKDAVLLGVWCIAAARRTVQWRGNLVRIGPGTTLESVTQPGGTRETARAST